MPDLAGLIFSSEQLPIAIVMMGIAVYAVGHVITRAHMSTYGFLELPLIETRYFTAGALFLSQLVVWSAVIWLTADVLFGNDLLVTASGAISVKFQVLVVVGFVSAGLILLLGVGALPILQWPPVNKLIVVGMRPVWIWFLLLLPLSLLTFSFPIRSVINGGQLEPSHLSGLVSKLSEPPYALMAFGSQVFGMALTYGFWVHSLVLPAVGGGRPSRVRLAGTAWLTPEARENGLKNQLDRSTHSTSLPLRSCARLLRH